MHVDELSHDLGSTLLLRLHGKLSGRRRGHAEESYTLVPADAIVD
jgi:hypothetical protein